PVGRAAARRRPGAVRLDTGALRAAGELDGALGRGIRAGRLTAVAGLRGSAPDGGGQADLRGQAQGPEGSRRAARAPARAGGAGRIAGTSGAAQPKALAL